MSSSKSKHRKSLSPRERRLQELWKKMENNDILRKIPARINPNVEFSEDEDDVYSTSFSDADNTISKFPSLSLTPTRLSLSLEDLRTKPTVYKRNPLMDLPIRTKKSIIIPKPVSLNLPEDRDKIYAETLAKIAHLGAKRCNLKGSSQDTKIPAQRKEEVKTNESKKCASIYEQHLPSLPLISEPINEDKFLKCKHEFVINGKTYGILSVLGFGGSCKVFSAIDQESRQLVAIKYVHLTDLDETMKKSFIKEAEYLKLLSDSDNVIKMYDYENNGNDLFMVLERGDTDFAHYLVDEKRKKNLSPIMIKYYWYQMLKAVSEIHSFGIIHCDLKPANFLLVSGHLKLIDFGIATSVPEDKTSIFRDNNLGTLNYMAPEAISAQSMPGGFEGVKIGTKCDVWSLGCILYDMVYGHTPFYSIKTSISKMYSITNPSYVIPFPPTTNEDLADVLKLCLERNPHKRASVQNLLSHPYIANEVPKSNVSDVVAQLQALSPRRMNIVCETIKKLSLQK